MIFAKKKGKYEQYGIQEYIMVDSIQFNAEVYASEERYFVQKQKASTPESLKSVLLPGLIIELGKLLKKLSWSPISTYPSFGYI